MIETKLRDVIEGVLAEYQGTFGPCAACPGIVNDVIRRLAHAQSIELDDGTLFVRRAPLPQITISTATTY